MLLFFRALFFDVGAPKDRRSLRWPAMCDAFHSLSHSSGKLSFWTFGASHEIRGARRADLGMQGVDRKPAFNPAKKPAPTERPSLRLPPTLRVPLAEKCTSRSKSISRAGNNADLCVQILILQHFSRSARFAFSYTSPNSKFQQNS